MTVKVVWHIVKESAKRIGVAKLAAHDLRRYTACGMSDGPLLGSAMPREASWSRSNFSWGTFRCKRPNATLAASSGFDQPSMIVLASSRIPELRAVVEELPTIRSLTISPLNATQLGEGLPRCVAVAGCSDSARRRVLKQPLEINSIACRMAYGKILLVGGSWSGDERWRFQWPRYSFHTRFASCPSLQTQPRRSK